MAQFKNLIVTGSTRGVGKGQFAGLISTAHNELISAGNEFNFIPPGYNSDIYINYQTSNGTTGTVNRYRFCKSQRDSGSAIIVASTFEGNVAGNVTGNVTGRINHPGLSSSWYQGRNNALVTQTGANGYSPIMSMKTTNGSWEIGHYNADGYHNQFLFNYKDDAEYNAGTPNAVVHAFRLTKDGDGIIDNTFRVGHRLYCDEWIELSQCAGLYFPNHNGLHITPNNVSRYTPLRIMGAREGYNGMLFGNDNTGLNIMCHESGGHLGLYNESNSRWMFYYNRTKDSVSIGDASAQKDSSSNMVASAFLNVAGSAQFSGAGYFTGGRLYGSGDDEGVIIGRASNSYAGLILGAPTGVRSVFYLKNDNSASWRWCGDGTNAYDIYHPGVAGTIPVINGTSTSSVGSAVVPVYISGKKFVACAGAASGSYKSFVPNVGADGVMEIGQYIDMHVVGSTKDYDARLNCNGSGITITFG